MMSDNIKETIKTIAVRHGIAVSPDDPIMILHTLNERLLQDTQATQQAMLDRFKSELEEITHRWSEDAKNKAEKIVNASLTASKEAMVKGMSDGTTATTEAIRRELERCVSKLAAPLRDTRRMFMLNMVAASLAVVAAALVLWVVM